MQRGMVCVACASDCNQESKHYSIASVVLHALPETVFYLWHYFIFLPKQIQYTDWRCMIIGLHSVCKIQSIIKLCLRFVINDTAVITIRFGYVLFIV